MKYFAYGSNMSPARLKDRVESACAIGKAKLSGYSLAWHKVSKDGSGKCDIVNEYSANAHVWGVLYEIDPSDKKLLDRAEGLGYGYNEKTVIVELGSEKVSAIAYIATKTDPSILPYHWYKNYVVSGAKENGLPEEYIQKLESVKSSEDPNPTRLAKHQI